MLFTDFTIVSLQLAALDAAIAFVVLLVQALIHRRRGRQAAITAWGMVVAGAFMTAACVVKLTLLRRNHWHDFGTINALYTEIVLGLPLFSALSLAAAVLRRGGRPFFRATRPAVALAVFGLLPAPVGIYASFIEPFRLVVEEVAVPLARGRAGSAPLRIGVISDFQTSHVTDHERAAVRLLMAQRPDIILLAGDLYQGDPMTFKKEVGAFQELHASLTAPGGIFCVLGNLDPYHWVQQATKDTGVRILFNEIAEVRINDRRLWIAGLGGPFSGQAEQETVRRLESIGDPKDIRIILSHWPDAVLRLTPQSPVDLVVAGHTHGGQARLPWIGALARASAIPRKAAGGGLSEINAHALYVNRGIGLERSQAPRFRFLCPPTVSILNLTGPDNPVEAMPETAPGG